MGMKTYPFFQNEHPGDWELLRSSPLWKESESVVRTVDFVYGHSDRFRKKPGENMDKNVMIQVDAGVDSGGRYVRLQGVGLIDNDLGVPGHADFDISLAPIREHVSDPMKKAINSISAEELEVTITREKPFLPMNGIRDYARRLRDIAARLVGDDCYQRFSDLVK